MPLKVIPIYIMLLRLSYRSVVEHVLAHLRQRYSMGLIPVLNLGLSLNLARLGHITS